MPDWILSGSIIRRPAIMAVLNVTPDSFSDGGLALDPLLASHRAADLVDQGADILDLGGESTRPGASPVPLDLELRRVIPVLEALRERIGVPLSIDTTKAEVARIALANGASIVNDISAATLDPRMLEVVADANAGLVLMHMQGTPDTMQADPDYSDVVAEVLSFLQNRVAAAERAGIPRPRIAVDPGIGFGKTLQHNLSLLRHLRHFRDLGCAVLVGTSRKRFLGALTGRDVHQRAPASLASALAALAAGADVARVHDVAPTRDAINVWNAQLGWDL